MVMAAGRVAVVTGAGSGIGAAIATWSTADGATVIVLDLHLESASETVEAIRSAGGTAEAVACDVSDPQSVQRVFKDIVDRHGRVDILVNNAGLQHVAPIDTYPFEKWQQLIGVLLTGPFLTTQAVLPTMREQKWGRIINISSINGKRGDPGKAAYCAAKHGVIGLTRTAALEAAADGIRSTRSVPATSIRR